MMTTEIEGRTVQIDETTLELWTPNPELGSKIRCRDCGRWTTLDEGRIRHDHRCDTPEAQPAFPTADPVTPSPTATSAYDDLLRKVNRGRQAIREGAISAVLTDDEILRAVQLGLISEDDALDRDF